MRPSLATQTLSLLTFFISSSEALLALANSPCAVSCGNVLGSTSGSDIVCSDSSYTSSNLVGYTFENCISCQISSTYVDTTTNQTDLGCGLYNLRYAVSWCLFGYLNNTAVLDTPCATSFACGPIEDAFEYDSLATNFTSPYEYCVDLNGYDLPRCAACVHELSTNFYLSNFVTALTAGCDQKPTAGSTISIQGSLFSTTVVNITTPSPTAAAYHLSGGLTLPTTVAIAVCGLVVILVITGFCIVCFGRRRRRRALAARRKESGYSEWPGDNGLGGHVPIPDTPGTGRIGYFDSPQSQKPLNSNNWGALVRPALDTTGPEKAYFSPYTSPYASQYSSPVSAKDAVPVVPSEWPYPVDQKPYYDDHKDGGDSSPESIVPGDQRGQFDRKGGEGHSSGFRQRSRERQGERIEMQTVKVESVTYRQGHTNGNSIALTDEDFRQGKAL